MGNFIKSVFKWLAALITAYVILFFLVMIFITGIGTLFQPQPLVLDNNTTLVLDLGFDLTDGPGEDEFADFVRGAIEGEMPISASLKETIEGLKAAREDSRINGLVITGNIQAGATGASFAGLRDLRQAIEAFGKEKPVWSYIDTDSLRDIYIKTAATEVISNPHGFLDFRGLRAERVYFGEAFRKIGVEVQVSAFEEFKTAAEPFKEARMSEEERLQISALLDDLWGVTVSDIARTRPVDEEHLNGVAGRELVVYGSEIMEAGLSDRALSHDEFIGYIGDEGVYNPDIDSFRQVGFIDYLGIAAPALPQLELIGSANKVAVIYAEGILVDGESEDGVVGSATLVQYLRDVRLDDSVKAVVLRVNSPGGSATASFKVVREIELTNARKPVVASMGGIATSAGYMISAPCGEIMTEPTTITGSIGVVSMLPNIEGLLDKLSLEIESVETHPLAGAFSLSRPKTPAEMEQLRELGENFYQQFLSVVATGRDMSEDSVRSIAGGRVWSGLAALSNGLADSEGGLMNAVRRAADLAGIGDDFSIIEKPRALTFEEQIEEFLTVSGVSRTRAGKPGILEARWNDLRTEFRKLNRLNDPYGLYAILPYSLKIQ